MVEKKLIELLACPVCKRSVQHKHSKNENNGDGYLECVSCCKKFDIINNIPVMIEKIDDI